VTILHLGLLGVFPAVWKKGKFPHFFEVGGETIFGHQDFQHLWYLPLVDKYLKGKYGNFPIS